MLSLKNKIDWFIQTDNNEKTIPNFRLGKCCLSCGFGFGDKTYPNCQYGTLYCTEHGNKTVACIGICDDYLPSESHNEYVGIV